MTILILAEHDNATLNPATAKAVTAAKSIGGDIHVVVAGSGVTSVADQAAKLDGVTKVLIADAPHLANVLAEEVSALLVKLMSSYDVLIAPATASGKNILPRVAALLDVMQISDVTAVKGPDTFERPIYAGNALQTVKSSDPKKVITARTAAFAAGGEGGNAVVETIDVPAAAGLSSFKGAELTKSDRPDLSSARIIISGGRGLQSGDNFKTLIEPVADKLGAAIGASRAAVDAGFVPNVMQVVQTG